MADRTSSSITISAAAPDVMAVIADFPAYPGWAKGITSAKVLSEDADGRAERVRITLDAGPFRDTYVLAYHWDEDKAVHWNLAESGTMLTGMTGAYRLVTRDGSTEVTYELAVEVRMPIVGMVRRKAEKRIIEAALKGLKRRVEG